MAEQQLMWSRRWLIVPGVILAYIVTMLLDNKIALFFCSSHTPLLNDAMVWVSNVATVIAVLIFMSALFLYEEKKQEWIPVLLLSAICAFLIVALIKQMIYFKRPFDALGIIPLVYVAGSSFPSAHAAVAFSTVPVLEREFKMLKWAWVLFAVLIAFSRVYLCVHYMSDVILGLALGYGVGYVFVKTEEKTHFFKNLQKKYYRG